MSAKGVVLTKQTAIFADNIHSLATTIVAVLNSSLLLPYMLLAGAFSEIRIERSRKSLMAIKVFFEAIN